jgi:hypothetical protein
MSDVDRLALLIPGAGYSTDRPLLHFAAAVFEKHGWRTLPVRWRTPVPARGPDLAAWFTTLRSYAVGEVTPVLDEQTAPRIALVGKSLGSFAAAPAADRGLPGIWLTPPLRDTELAADLRRATAPFLLAGGAADRAWDSAVAHRFGGPVFEAPGADHGLELPGQPLASVDILRDLTAAMDDFVERITLDGGERATV